MTDENDLPAEVRKQDEEAELQVAAQLAELRKGEDVLAWVRRCFFGLGSGEFERPCTLHGLPAGLASRQAHAPGGRVLLIRPGRRSASDFTIRSVSRRISALNGPTSSQ